MQWGEIMFQEAILLLYPCVFKGYFINIPIDAPFKKIALEIINDTSESGF